MTAQDKAAELYGRFMDYADTTCNTERDNIKHCALIAVDEILGVLFQHHEIDYWKQVKQEINKL